MKQVIIYNHMDGYYSWAIRTKSSVSVSEREPKRNITLFLAKLMLDMPGPYTIDFINNEQEFNKAAKI